MSATGRSGFGQRVRVSSPPRAVIRIGRASTRHPASEQELCTLPRPAGLLELPCFTSDKIHYQSNLSFWSLSRSEQVQRNACIAIWNLTYNPNAPNRLANRRAVFLCLCPAAVGPAIIIGLAVVGGIGQWFTQKAKNEEHTTRIKEVRDEAEAATKRAESAHDRANALELRISVSSFAKTIYRKPRTASASGSTKSRTT